VTAPRRAPPDHRAHEAVYQHERRELAPVGAQAHADHVRARVQGYGLRAVNTIECDGTLALGRQELAHALDELRREEGIARAVIHGEPALVVRCDVYESRSF
jgi:hypothetical protein